ncbi:potassium transporter TrkG [Mesobacterium sp. TK19101]|uniref:Potassium transporter TrkG n=1 Tax=Mesobacterium hydrothermale TaxID=3111907 RepID=A0ABU6HEU6_9RHOB|nr:potassium transporter TrkG [Mesobacterium sp. TK19101]MEC3860989.1 potassium transporter TrkG [Mesobacterium sp. TK19101]
MRVLASLPLFLMLMGLFSVSMVAPAALALGQDGFHDARSFFYAGLGGLVLTSFVGLATAGRETQRSSLRQLVALLGVFVLLPAFLAVPFHEAVRTTSFVNAYFEMVSSLTTTGASLFEPSRLSDAEHLWRAQVGWIGGYLMWVAAAAILAPLALGGFEVTASSEPGQVLLSGSAQADSADPAKRLLRSARMLAPVYGGLTLALWLMLLVAGDTPFVALCHAMSVLATSGISPVGGLSGSQSGIAGEMLMFLFMFFALSRLTFSNDTMNTGRPGLRHDPEFRAGLAVIVIVPALLILRHWVAAFETGDEEDLVALAQALWGSLFTVMSFLTTTGFESVNWDDARGWSGLETPGMILMGLALIGGGVATTAGGVKLLRVLALYLNGVREIERLIHPSSVGRANTFTRRIRREGAFIAWVFFMLFAMTLALYTTIFGLMGVRFEHAILMSVAGLSNAGPLVTVTVAEQPLGLLGQPGYVKMLFASAMVLGRLELLAIIVMLTPDAWRD